MGNVARKCYLSILLVTYLQVSSMSRRRGAILYNNALWEIMTVCMVSNAHVGMWLAADFFFFFLPSVLESFWIFFHINYKYSWCCKWSSAEMFLHVFPQFFFYHCHQKSDPINGAFSPCVCILGVCCSPVSIVRFNKVNRCCHRDMRLHKSCF